MPSHTAPSSRRFRRAAALAAIPALVATLTAGCTGITDTVLGRTPTPTVTQLEVPAGQEALAEFYEQEIDWVSCGQHECAELEVPIDYAEPEGERIELSLLKVPARNARQRLGSLVVNPGGPGGSGVDYAMAADFIVGTSVRQRYDVVGFDPRGVGRSAPIDCASDEEMDVQLGFIDDPQDRSDVELGADFGEGCSLLSGMIAGNVSTIDAAKDMDILRAALGEPKLNYLGVSYGTYLGAVFAEQFPERVGRFVLDAALPPDLTGEEMTLGQAAGFERATRAWAQDCIDGGSCPLGDDVDGVMDGLGELLRGLDDEPAQVSGDVRITDMTMDGAFWGVIAAMYDQGMWAILTDALTDIVNSGDGTSLQGLANRYAQRTPSGTYVSNLLEANTAINCLDRSPTQPSEEFRAQAAEVAPLWGPIFTETEASGCADWPYPVVGGERTIAAEGADPIVVIGTTRDPATPYEWAQRLADQLSSGVLVSYDGDGHAAYQRSNACVDDAIDAYLIEGTVPEDGLTC